MVIIRQELGFYEEILIRGKERDVTCLAFPFAVLVQRIDGTLVYNNLTKALVLITDADECNTTDLLTNQDSTDEPNDKAPTDANSIRTLAKSLKIPENRKGKTSFTILTTTDCNARCYYCYENGCDKVAMTEDTARDVAQHIIKVCNHDKTIKLQWFGGEPLYNNAVIDVICDELDKAGISYKSGMISNGYLLDEVLIAKALDKWHLKKIQITIDGTKDVYNKVKNYIYAGDAYERVVHNVELLLQAGIRVDVRLNVSDNNADNLYALVDELSDRFAEYKNGKLLNVYSRLIYQERDGEYDDAWREAHSRYMKIKNHIYDVGIGRPPALGRNIKINACMVDSDVSEAILPDGRLTSCEHFNEGPEPWGSIYSDERNEETIKKWHEYYEPVEECKTCPLYPTCIKPKLCPGTKPYCREEERQEQIEDIKRAMVIAYEEYLKNGEIKSSEEDEEEEI